MRPSVRYLRKRKGKGLERIGIRFESKAKPSFPTQSVKFKCKIWYKITKKFAKKCLDASV